MTAPTPLETPRPDGPSAPEDIRIYMQVVDRVLAIQSDLNATLQKITDANSASQNATHFVDLLAELAVIIEHRPKRVQLAGADAERERENDEKLNQLKPVFDAEISRIRQVSAALPILRAALDSRLASEKDEAVAKRLRANGGFVYDVQAIDRLTLLEQTLQTVQKMLDAERRITDVDTAKKLSPQVARLMAEHARLVDQQPHVEIRGTNDEVAKCEALTTRINALIQTHHGEVDRITAIPDVGGIFRTRSTQKRLAIRTACSPRNCVPPRATDPRVRPRQETTLRGPRR